MSFLFHCMWRATHKRFQFYSDSYWLATLWTTNSSQVLAWERLQNVKKFLKYPVHTWNSEWSEMKTCLISCKGQRKICESDINFSPFEHTYQTIKCGFLVSFSCDLEMPWCETQGLTFGIQYISSLQMEFKRTWKHLWLGLK